MQDPPITQRAGQHRRLRRVQQQAGRRLAAAGMAQPQHRGQRRLLLAQFVIDLLPAAGELGQCGALGGHALLHLRQHELLARDRTLGLGQGGHAGGLLLLAAAHPGLQCLDTRPQLGQLTLRLGRLLLPVRLRLGGQHRPGSHRQGQQRPHQDRPHKDQRQGRRRPRARRARGVHGTGPGLPCRPGRCHLHRLAASLTGIPGSITGITGITGRQVPAAAGSLAGAGHLGRQRQAEQVQHRRGDVAGHRHQRRSGRRRRPAAPADGMRRMRLAGNRSALSGLP